MKSDVHLSATSPHLIMSLRRGPCLTQPSQAVANEGFDNTNGDLIVCVGDIIEGANHRFQVVKFLGAGQFGQVFHVLDVTAQTPSPQSFAMKICKSIPRYQQQSQFEINILSRILREATPTEMKTMSKMHCWFQYHSHFCIVIELLSFDLYTVLVRRNYRGLSVPLIQSTLRTLLQALLVLKRCGIIHSDIKPENILLVDGFSAAIKLIDFGSSRIISQPCYYYIQSRYYRAPEVVLNIQHDYQIDIWSLGCVAAELFLGMPLLPGENEVHLLCLIDEMFGPFPAEMIEASSRKNEFFLPNGQMKPQAQIYLEKGIPPCTFVKYFTYSTLEDIIFNYAPDNEVTPDAERKERGRRELMLDLLKKMLTLNPQQRITVEDALHHPFLNADFSE